MTKQVVLGRVEELRARLARIPDPEIPVLTIADLGILRDLRIDAGGHVEVDITPTYSGCPALDAIRADVERTVREAGFDDVMVRTVLAPAWTTDWLSDDAKRALREHGIAPPSGARPGLRLLQLAIECPVCGSTYTDEVAHFASTPCQALRRCRSCGEPFNHFKDH